MPTYLPFYSKGDARTPALISDPVCVLYLPLWKKDAAVFTSEDSYGHKWTRAGATWTPQGFSTDGVDDTIVMTGTPECLAINSGDITVLAWAKPLYINNTNWGILYTNEKTWNKAIYCLGLTKSTGYWSWKMAQDDTTFLYNHVSYCAVQYGQWQMVGFTFRQGGPTYCFFNTVFYLQAAKTGTVISGSNIGIPAPTASNWFKGTIGELAIWKRALSRSEIVSYYNATRGRYE
jgi:hypothetical protein